MIATLSASSAHGHIINSRSWYALLSCRFIERGSCYGARMIVARMIIKPAPCGQWQRVDNLIEGGRPARSSGIYLSNTGPLLAWRKATQIQNRYWILLFRFFTTALGGRAT